VLDPKAVSKRGHRPRPLHDLDQLRVALLEEPADALDGLVGTGLVGLGEDGAQSRSHRGPRAIAPLIRGFNVRCVIWGAVARVRRAPNSFKPDSDWAPVRRLLSPFVPIATATAGCGGWAMIVDKPTANSVLGSVSRGLSRLAKPTFR
jgi:hypothetical protein